MFVIVQDNFVVLGPMKWNRFRFENFLVEECETTFTLDTRNDDEVPVIISDSIKILPIQGTPDPQYNPKIEILHGPFWEYTDTHAISSYQVVEMPIDAVKNNLKALAASERWNKLNKAVSVTIDGNTYNFDTSAQTIFALQQAITSQIAQLNWKFNSDSWVVLQQSDILLVLQSITTYIQTCFDWELSIINEINACESLQELDAIEIVAKPSQGPGVI